MPLNAQILAALRTFHVAADATSFSQASERLHISPAAVSQQMTNLETQLELELFKRHSRGIRLTEAGQSLQAVVKPTLERISRTVSELQKREKSTADLRIKATPSFSHKWLVPKLQDFYQKHPDIRIELFADSDFVDKNQRQDHLLIDFAPIPYPDPTLTTELLLHEQIVPIMSHQYAAQFDWQDPRVWQQVTLLHDTMVWPGYRFDCEWQHWFRAHGVEQTQLAKHLMFNRTDLALEAARASQGIAIGRLALVQDELYRSEWMTAPFPAVYSPFGYFTVNNPKKPADSELDSFKSWLKHSLLNPSV